MRGRTERGFSLLEAVAALAILGLTGIAALRALTAETQRQMLKHMLTGGCLEL